MRSTRTLLLILAMLLTLGAVFVIAQDNPDGFPTPEMVTVPGSFQDAVGCPGEWQPECEDVALSFDEDSGIWSGTFLIPAGSYEYKAALNGSWDANYGANGEMGGANIALEVAEDTEVTFTYDHSTGWVNDSINNFDTTAVAVEEPVDEPATVPDLVNIPGTIQSALGCPGDWAPDCETTALTYNEDYNIFEGTFTLPAGNYEYKVAINGSWDENYGALADAGGANIALGVAEDTDVTWVYSHETNWIMDTVRHQIVTAPGSYQDEAGCAGEWQPECMVTWLQDVDGDGIYTYSTDAIPAGEYEAKVAVGRSWDINYGDGGVEGGDNIAFTVPSDGETVTFTYDSSVTTMVVSVGGGAISGSNLSERRAYWVSADTIAWDIEPSDSETYRIMYSADASINVSLFGIDGDFVTYDLSVNPDGLSEAVLAKFPHLEGLTALTLGEEALAAAPEILTGQFAVTAYNGENVVNMSGLQIPGVLDDLYTYDGSLGVTFDGQIPTISVWAPTATNVALNLYPSGAANEEATTYEMTRDDEFGVWSIAGEASWYGQYYTYTVDVYAPTEMAFVQNEVTDPYSISLSQNSTRTQILDLNDSAYMPVGWLDMVKPELDAPEDITVYELHVRDFSIFDETVPEAFRGTYFAFTNFNSDGMQHLASLADAGLTHLHLLPTFDIATINENRNRHFEPDYADFEGLPVDSPDQQAAVNQIRDLDGFNWGYDPFHYMALEGSYAVVPDGGARILEYRQMVQSINSIGLRVVQDVVFNHTNASGQSARSVLDQIVPGYYHRLDAAGRVTRSTCCENTATEHNMMRRLMVDTVVMNAVYYQIDAFRFDLMGHHMVDDMIAVQEAVSALTLENDGVDGSSIYLYGEGWNFGEVADNAHGINATQFNLAGTGIGTFSDRLRDAVRGGSPFGGRDEQGFSNGIYTDPNGMNPANENLDRALLFADQIRVGLAGNLQTYQFIDRTGAIATGLDVDYNGSPAGYTLDPQENVVYVSKHDNETLFDSLVFRIPTDTSMADLVRMQNISLSFPMFSQGVPFFQAASDMLRSKSLDRDSYNSGDWFNAIDWSYNSTNFGVGLPIADKNEERWERISEILNNEAWYPSSDDIMMNAAVFNEYLQIRYSSPLFRLETADDVQNRVGFFNVGADQVPGVIVMGLTDISDLDADIDPNYDYIVVVFNASDETIDYEVPVMTGLAFELHPVQQNSADAVVQTASYAVETGTFSVPAYTTAVYVVPQAE